VPLSLPRRSLGVEIAVTLAVKVAALAALAFLLFGPDDRPRADAQAVGEALVGDRP
jgi:hypothetical protein